MSEAVPWVRDITIDWIDPDDLDAVEDAAAEAKVKEEEKEAESQETERVA